MSEYYKEYEAALKKQLAQALAGIEAAQAAALAEIEAGGEGVRAGRNARAGGAYSDYAKNINPYGVQSEKAYASGLGGAGKGETAHANYYNAYQVALALINSDADTSLKQLDTQRAKALSDADGERANARAQAYGQLLEELQLRRKQEYDALNDKRGYELKVEQARIDQQNWEREYALKVAAAAAKGGSSGGSKSTGGDDGELGEISDMLTNSQFIRLMTIMKNLKWSALAGEADPNARIRQTQAAYLKKYGDYMTPDQYELLVAACR